MPRRPLLTIAIVGTAFLAGLLGGISSTDDLVRATSACFIGVYVLALASAVRILDGAVRAGAAVTLVLVAVVAVFSSWFLLLPLVSGAVALGLRRSLARRPRRELARSPAGR